MPMEGKGRDQADDALGNPLGGLGKTVMTLRGGVRELIKSATEPGNDTLPFQPGDGGRSDSDLA